MSFRDCINRGVTGGEMDPKRAERVIAEYNSLFRQFNDSMGPTQADFEAAKVIVGKAKKEAKEKRRVAQLQAARSRELVQRLDEHRTMSGERSPGDFVQDLISNKRGSQGQSIAGLYETIRRTFRREFSEATTEFKANLFGQRRNKELLDNVVREVFGESTGDPKAQKIAQAWERVSEKSRTRFNAAGGHIGKRKDWGMPQAHDSVAVRRVKFQDWKSEILPRLDLEAMGKDFNDGVPFTPETIDLLLKDAYDAIRTDGYSRRSPSSRHGAAMYNRRADHRFFKFKSADDWMAYSEKFGAGQDAFRIMHAHLDNMANEISMMEILGPNPTTGFQFVKDAAKHRAATSQDPKAVGRLNDRLAQADNMFDLFTGRTNIPGHAGFAKGMAATRQFLTSAHLGSAIISSVTDFNTQRVAASFLGMKQTGYLKQLGRLLADKDFRLEAAEAGLIFENAVDMGNAVARFNLEEVHIEGAARMADFTIRSSGLGHLTEVQRQSFGLEFMSHMARGTIDDKMRRVLKQYGIGDQDLAAIMAAPKHKMRNGLEVIRAEEIEASAGQRVADLYMEAITSLTEFAVPSTDLYGRAAILSRSKAGTVGGELIRSALQFKAFPITVMTTQISRIMAEAMAGRKGSAMLYGANLFVGATLLGGLAIQLKEISKGRDPRDMTDLKFWMASMAQGGGLGIFGDFLFSDVNRFGGGIASTLGGPTVGLVNDVLKFSWGNLQELAMGEETNAGREFTNLMRRYTPGGSLWYLRLAYERAIIDQIQMVIDPRFRDSFRTKERNAKETGTSFYAPPGSIPFTGRSRGIDLENALGG